MLNVRNVTKVGASHHCHGMLFIPAWFAQPSTTFGPLTWLGKILEKSSNSFQSAYLQLFSKWQVLLFISFAKQNQNLQLLCACNALSPIDTILKSLTGNKKSSFFLIRLSAKAI